MNDLLLYALALEPSPSFPLILDALTLCRRNFWIDRVLSHAALYVPVQLSAGEPGGVYVAVTLPGHSVQLETCRGGDVQ